MDFPNDNRLKHREEGRVIFGIIVAMAGALILLYNLFPNLNVFYYSWWPLGLVILGLAIGLKSGFRRNAWWILVLIGGVHLLQPYFFPGVATHRIIWPGIMIAIGLAIVLRKRQPGRWDRSQIQFVSNDADTLNIDVTFGGRKEIVTSKNFKGGMVRASFAGAEINLSAADSGAQPMVLEVQATFAGVEIIVPSNWEVQNEINPTMGSVEDHRMIRIPDASAERRTLLLRGSCSFGSVEIKSY